jgi:hypothetical protein
VAPRSSISTFVLGVAASEVKTKMVGPCLIHLTSLCWPSESKMRMVGRWLVHLISPCWRTAAGSKREDAAAPERKPRRGSVEEGAAPAKREPIPPIESRSRQARADPAKREPIPPSESRSRQARADPAKREPISPSESPSRQARADLAKREPISPSDIMAVLVFFLGGLAGLWHIGESRHKDPIHTWDARRYRLSRTLGVVLRRCAGGPQAWRRLSCKVRETLGWGIRVSGHGDESKVFAGHG